MNIIEQTIDWHKGEAFEATLIGVFGLIIIILLTIVIWLFGKTLNAQALCIPLLVVGMIFIAAGVNGIISNNKTAKTLATFDVPDNKEFIESEKQRVQSFQYMYTYTKIGATVFFSIAMILFFVTRNRHWQTIGIALILLGVTGLVIDYFSKERADNYYQAISKVIE